MDKDRTDMILEIDPIVELELHITVVEIEGTIKTEIIMVMETIGLGMEIIKPLTDRMTGPILTKIMAKEIEIGAQVENMRGLGPDIEVPQEIIQQAGTELIKVQVEIENIGPELPQEKEKGKDQGLDPVPMSVQIGTGQDAIDAMNMTTLLENALTIYWRKST